MKKPQPETKPLEIPCVESAEEKAAHECLQCGNDLNEFKLPKKCYKKQLCYDCKDLIIPLECLGCDHFVSGGEDEGECVWCSRNKERVIKDNYKHFI